MPADVEVAVRDEIGKLRLEDLWVGNGHGAREGIKEISDAPAAHDRVVGKNQKGRKHGKDAERRAPAAADAHHGRHDGAAAAAAERNFCHHEHDADREREEDVGNDEGGAAVGARPERKLPDGADADRGARGG